MKTLCTIRPWILGFVGFALPAADLTLPILTGSQLAVIDSRTGDGPHLTFELVIDDLSRGENRYYRIGSYIRTTSSGFPVRSLPTRIDFLAGAVIGPTNKDYLSDGGSNGLGLQTFDEFQEHPWLEWKYFDVLANAPATSFAKTLRAKTNVFIGYRFTAEDGSHYGWLQFSRPDTTFTTLFQLTAQDWNPLPGEPIVAGLPPAIPLVPEVQPDGLHLSWPPAVAGWILEASPELGAKAEWLPVEGVNATDVILPPPDGTWFFRLRRP